MAGNVNIKVIQLYCIDIVYVRHWLWHLGRGSYICNINFAELAMDIMYREWLFLLIYVSEYIYKTRV